MTASNLSFNPDWVTPPGTTLKDVIDFQGRTLSEFAKTMHWGANELMKLIKGRTHIDPDVASLLERVTGTPADFWLKREKNYRQAIERLDQQDAAEMEWLSGLPTADMANFGWIDKVSNRKEKLMSCLKFFDVFSVDEWQAKYNCLLSETAFRTSQSFDSTNESISCWLRQGEIEASKIECASWNRSGLTDLIPTIRSLCTISNKDLFIPKLIDLLASCGVALAIVKSPSGCRASGATFWPSSNSPIILLSFRYLSDDHFWFTLFHEIGHLVLHSDHRLILETKENDSIDIEKEANFFAENVLIPEEFQAEMLRLNEKNLRGILKFSQKIGVSRGITVGQLQHKGIIPAQYLNKLKVRYSW